MSKAEEYEVAFKAGLVKEDGKLKCPECGEALSQEEIECCLCYECYRENEREQA